MLRTLTRILPLLPTQHPLLLHPRYPLSISISPYPSPISTDKKLSPKAQRHAMLTYTIRSCNDIESAMKVIEENRGDVEEMGKALVLDFFNQFYMDSRNAFCEGYFKLNDMLAQFKDMTVYEKTLQLSIIQKTKIFYSLRNNLTLHESLAQKCVQSLISQIDQDKLSINDYFNILIIFRVQTQQKLILKCFQALDRIIVDVQHQNQYAKIWRILFHQFQYYSWKELSKYGNIIRFFTNQFSVRSSAMNTEQLVVLFYEMCKFKLHLVGERKLPICLKQLMEILHPKLSSLSVKNMSMLIKACAELPAGFYPNFKADLIRKFHGKMGSGLTVDAYFPFEGLSNQDLDVIFKNQNNSFNALWFSFLYKTRKADQKAFLRGPIPQYLKNYLSKTVETLKTDNTAFSQKNQTVSRLCSFIPYLHSHRDIPNLQKIKQILTHQINKLSINCFSQFSLTNFLHLMVLFHEDPILLEDVKKLFYVTFMKRREKTVLYNSSTEENCLQAIQFYVDTEVKVVQDAVVLLVRELVGVGVGGKGDGQGEGIRDIEIRLLLELIKFRGVLPCGELEEARRKLWAKVTDKDLEIVLDYYILSNQKTLKSLQQIIREFTARKTPFLLALKFLSCLPPSSMENNRGRLEQSLTNYLNSGSETLASELKGRGIKYLNDINRALSIFSYRPALENFVRKLYLTTVEELYDEIWETKGKGKEFQLQGTSARKLIDFMMKFQQILQPKQLVTHSQLLQKLYNLYLALLSKDPNPYPKTRFLDFILVYRQYIPIPQGTEIEPAFSIQVVLEMAKNLPEFSEILFILVKLHCFGLERLERGVLGGYCAAVGVEIGGGRLGLLKLVDKVASINYQARVLRLSPQDLQPLKQTISPLLQKSLSTTPIPTLPLLRPFLNYFYSTNELSTLKPSLTLILNQHIDPESLLYIVNSFPVKVYDAALFGLVLKKCGDVAGMFSVNGLQVLYFLERVFYLCPEEYRTGIEQFWAVMDRILEQKIASIKNEKSYDRINYTIGRYPLYLFSCIKRQKCQDNPNYKFLSLLLSKYGHEFLELINQNQLLKGINKGIYLYVREDFRTGGRGDAGFMDLLDRQRDIRIMPNLQYSKRLETRLQKEGKRYDKDYKLNNITLAYYLQESKEIILVANTFHACSIGPAKQPFRKAEGQFNGLFKFYVEVYRKIFQGCTVRVYDDIGDRFIE